MRFFFHTALCVLGAALSLNVAATQCTSLRVAGASQWFPFAYNDPLVPNIPQGIAFDVVRLIASDINIPIQYIDDLPWRRIEQAMLDGSVDLLAGNYANSERESAWLLTQPFSIDDVRVFVKLENPIRFDKLKDLENYTGLIPSGVSFGREFDDYKHKLNITEVELHEQMVSMLISQRADYIVLPRFSGLKRVNLLGFQGKVVPLDTPISKNNVHLSMSRESPCKALLNTINERILENRKNGNISAIEAKYAQ